MAEPKTEIERRMERIENAVATMAHRLGQTQGVFTEDDYKDIMEILDGTKTTPEDSTRTAD